MMAWLANTLPVADAWSMHDADVGFGWWLVMTVGMIVFWGGVVAVVVWLLRGGGAATRPTAAPTQDTTPRQVLDRRLADGSLSVEEYERRLRLLDRPADSAHETGAPTPPGEHARAAAG